MMPIFTAQMPTEGLWRRRSRFRGSRLGLTLAETMVAIVIASLFLIMAVLNFGRMLRRNTVKGQLYEFVSTMQMAARAAAESDRRYEVIVDIAEQGYLLREITSSDLSQVFEEEIIAQGDFSKDCVVVYIEFDDGDFTSDSRAKFRVGHSGWQYGGMIVFVDSDEQIYTVLVNRLNRAVALKEGEVSYVEPRGEDEMSF